PNKNDFNGKATVYQNTETFLAKPGDLVVFNRTFGGGYGHVAWVIEATLDYIIVLEQNWLGGGWTSGDIWNGTGWETVT
ncbi:CHAP domain-containing protein, partial [Staphylococcus aureus]|nr:CHAP domain-containing protein [Staphylococcus aureus]